jgi:predicted ATP-grasp superfamily ATP-dependent carboligase
MKVLVTDGEYKQAVAAIRNLGRHGVNVVVASARRSAPGFFSRYCTERVLCPEPEDEAFLPALLEHVDRLSVDVILPIGGAATSEISRDKAAAEAHAAVPVAPWESMVIAADKRRSAALAEELGVPVPRTYADRESVDSFPVVAKRAWGSGVVRYVNSPAELSASTFADSLVQEYVPGAGYGFFALFDQGEERAVFMHRRIREFPVTGGASTAAVSVYDPLLEELGLRMLRGLRWHGVAMVEFKRDSRDGRYKLVEVNPKFWGSLDLAVEAGVEFPWLAVQLALGRPLPTQDGYPTGVRFRWVFEDLMHAVARPRDLGAFLSDFRDGSVRHDFDRADLKPSLIAAGRTLAGLAVRAKRRALLRPHGAPHIGSATDRA